MIPADEASSRESYGRRIRREVVRQLDHEQDQLTCRSYKDSVHPESQRLTPDAARFLVRTEQGKDQHKGRLTTCGRVRLSLFTVQDEADRESSGVLS